MFLNIHRNGDEGYTHLQIFEENDNALTTPIELSITGNASYVSQSDILGGDAAYDWILFNLAQYWYANKQNDTGYFKARVVRKEEGVVVDESGFTHFNMVKLTVGNIANNSVTFTVKGAVPVIYREENGQGNGTNKYNSLDTNEYTYDEETGVYTVDADVTDYTADNYIRLFAKTYYGMVNIRKVIS